MISPLTRLHDTLGLRTSPAIFFGSAAERSATGPGGRYRLLGESRDGVLVLEPTTWVQQPRALQLQ